MCVCEYEYEILILYSNQPRNWIKLFFKRFIYAQPCVCACDRERGQPTCWGDWMFAFVRAMYTLTNKVPLGCCAPTTSSIYNIILLCTLYSTITSSWGCQIELPTYNIEMVVVAEHIWLMPPFRHTPRASYHPKLAYVSMLNKPNSSIS